MPDDNPFAPESGAPAPPAVSSEPVPQFSTAEYAHVPGAEKCRVCGRSLIDNYYRVNGHMACDTCARKIADGRPVDSHAAFVQALMLGIGAAIVGMVVYATVEILTHWTIGYLALGVGWLIAKAMMKGSGGIGGRRYQVVAVLLTYMAISTAAVPVGISFIMAKKRAATQSSQSTGATSPDASSATSSGNASQPQPKMGMGKAVAALLFLCLASPFLELQNPASGLIGLFILFIGLRIAWQMTRAKVLSVDGPYSVTAT